MKIDLKTGLLDEASYAPSPHCNSRPDDTIDMIVVHGISLPPAEFGGKHIENFFCGTLDYTAHPYFDTIKHLKVTSHLLIDRQGQITQFVPFQRAARGMRVSRVFTAKVSAMIFPSGLNSKALMIRSMKKFNTNV